MLAVVHVWVGFWSWNKEFWMFRSSRGARGSSLSGTTISPTATALGRKLSLERWLGRSGMWIDAVEWCGYPSGSVGGWDGSRNVLLMFPMAFKDSSPWSSFWKLLNAQRFIQGRATPSALLHRCHGEGRDMLRWLSHMWEMLSMEDHLEWSQQLRSQRENSRCSRTNTPTLIGGVLQRFFRQIQSQLEPDQNPRQALTKHFRTLKLLQTQSKRFFGGALCDDKGNSWLCKWRVKILKSFERWIIQTSLFISTCSILRFSKSAGELHRPGSHSAVLRYLSRPNTASQDDVRKAAGSKNRQKVFKGHGHKCWVRCRSRRPLELKNVSQSHVNHVFDFCLNEKLVHERHIESSPWNTTLTLGALGNANPFRIEQGLKLVEIRRGPPLMQARHDLVTIFGKFRSP